MNEEYGATRAAEHTVLDGERIDYEVSPTALGRFAASVRKDNFVICLPL
jgi:hypothetical protein